VDSGLTSSRTIEIIPTTTAKTIEKSNKIIDGTIDGVDAKLLDIANELKNSVETNKLTQETVQKLLKIVAEIKTSRSKKQANETAHLTTAQQEIMELKSKIKSLNSTCEAEDELVLTPKITEQEKSVEIQLKELNKKFDVIAHKLDSMMNGT
jgi:hypothetical protein